jgi:DNA-binding MarR family transcriptional regulator
MGQFFQRECCDGDIQRTGNASMLVYNLMRDEKSLPMLSQTPCACAAARRAVRAVTELYDLVLAPTGLKATQFIMLRAIGEAGEIAQWQLAQGYAVANETLSRRLAAAKRKGLVQVRRGTRRSERLYRLTPAGQECVRTALPYWQRAQDRLKRALGEDDLRRAIDFLDRLTVAAMRGEAARTSNTAR